MTLVVAALAAFFAFGFIRAAGVRMPDAAAMSVVFALTASAYAGLTISDRPWRDLIYAAAAGAVCAFLQQIMRLLSGSAQPGAIQIPRRRARSAVRASRTEATGTRYAPGGDKIGRRMPGLP